MWSTIGFALLFGTIPKWDVAVYATGLYNRIGEFVDLSPRAIEQFAHEGWEAQFYVDGHSASVAVGQSIHTQNLWLSINGKVDASTGADMPTQVLSGELPQSIHNKTSDADTLVVGLASGVTANEAYRNGGTNLTVVELEPSIIDAAKLFHRVNDGIVDNPEVNLMVADARAVLQNSPTMYDVIISEPSNPWITGVSNLFTVDYWTLGRSRLREDGVFCQWVQLYALPPDGMRSLIASFIHVFPNTWLFETIPGSDALLIAAPNIPTDLPIAPTLNPTQLKNLAEGAPLNTDDFPWIEFEAPKWVNRPTGRMNRELIETAAQ
jgi:spermidine synthase